MGNSPGPVNSPHKWPVTRQMFPFDDVIMNKIEHSITVGCRLISQILGMSYAWWRQFFGYIFRVTGPLWRESNSHLWIPSQWLLKWSFDVFYDMRQNKRRSKQWRRRWFETPSHSVWRQCNGKRNWNRHDLKMDENYLHFQQILSPATDM